MTLCSGERSRDSAPRCPRKRGPRSTGHLRRRPDEGIRITLIANAFLEALASTSLRVSETTSTFTSAIRKVRGNIPYRGGGPANFGYASLASYDFCRQ